MRIESFVFLERMMSVRTLGVGEFGVWTLGVGEFVREWCGFCRPSTDGDEILVHLV